ncbi:MAG: ABC transporter substrate-binding protein [Myxococcota bacterium]|nr:ABC transporter substrate-binding protein [Myxococcota bacterium]
MSQIKNVFLSLGLVATFLLSGNVLFAETGETAASEVPAETPGAETSAPQDVVNELHAGLLKTMQESKGTGFQERFDNLKPVVSETFDVNFMGSKSVGRHWKKLTPEEQQLWLDKFVSYITANYVGNFNQFDGESFEVLGEEEAQRSTRIVLTRLNVPGGEDVLFNYRLRMTPEGWQIIDIYLKGTVSELALRRSDFTTTLKNKGFPVLASTVDKKIENLREEAGG